MTMNACNIKENLYSIADGARYLNIGLSSIKSLIRGRAFPVVRIGRRVLIRVSDLAAFVDQKATETAPSTGLAAVAKAMHP